MKYSTYEYMKVSKSLNKLLKEILPRFKMICDNEEIFKDVISYEKENIKFYCELKRRIDCCDEEALKKYYKLFKIKENIREVK